jgi:hypothetical protein
MLHCCISLNIKNLTMKRFLLTLLLIAPAAVFGQFKIDPDTKSMYNTRPAYKIDTVLNSNLEKKNLYSNALSFIAAAFPDSRNVVQVKDLELGEIMFNGNISKNYVETENKVTNRPRTLSSTLHFKCKIYLKDKKYKIVLYGLEAANSIFPDYTYTLDVPFLSGSTKESQFNLVGRELAISFIDSLVIALNKKPDSDF